jgi:hypothetical protein
MKCGRPPRPIAFSSHRTTCFQETFFTLRFQDTGRRLDIMPPSALRTRELICPLGSTTTTGLVDKLCASAFPVQGISFVAKFDRATWPPVFMSTAYKKLPDEQPPVRADWR